MKPDPSKLVNAARSVVGSKFAVQAAAMGWRYATHLEKTFIVKPEERSKLKAIEAVSGSGEAGKDHPIETRSAASILQALDSETDVSRLWDAIRDLGSNRWSATICDDFYHLTAEKIGEDVVSQFDDKRLNLLVLGAGLVGLALANALKMHFGQNANILVIETRVETAHIKRLYSRNWLTHITVDYWPGLFDGKLVDLVTKVGLPGFAGLPINALESLFLLSNRSLGVKFLFLHSYHLDFLNQAGLDIVFDATGGRLGYNFQNNPNPSDTKLLLDNYLSESFGKGFSKFGITNFEVCEKRELSVHSHENGSRIGTENGPITVPMMKITDIPKKLNKKILADVVKHNEDSKFYIWPGTLKNEINQLLLLVNLTVDEWNYLLDIMPSAIELPAFMKIVAEKPNVLDERYLALLNLIQDHLGDYAQPKVEPPFLYEPRIRLSAEASGTIGTTPFIPVGDSLFNGHPKVGNGVGEHLKLLHALITALKQ